MTKAQAKPISQSLSLLVDELQALTPCVLSAANQEETGRCQQAPGGALRQTPRADGECGTAVLKGTARKKYGLHITVLVATFMWPSLQNVHILMQKKNKGLEGRTFYGGVKLSTVLSLSCFSTKKMPLVV